MLGKGGQKASRSFYIPCAQGSETCTDLRTVLRFTRFAPCRCYKKEHPLRYNVHRKKKKFGIQKSNEYTRTKLDIGVQEKW